MVQEIDPTVMDPDEMESELEDQDGKSAKHL